MFVCIYFVCFYNVDCFVCLFCLFAFVKTFDMWARGTSSLYTFTGMWMWARGTFSGHLCVYLNLCADLEDVVVIAMYCL